MAAPDLQETALDRAFRDLRTFSQHSWGFRIPAIVLTAGFAVWGASLPATAPAGERIALAVAGTLGGALVIGIVAFAVLVALAPSRQRNDLRKAMPLVGTLIPPDYAASISGQQIGEGTWVPPGYEVKMGPEIIHDDRGNTVGPGRIVGPDAHGNTLLG